MSTPFASNNLTCIHANLAFNKIQHTSEYSKEKTLNFSPRQVTKESVTILLNLCQIAYDGNEESVHCGEQSRYLATWSNEIVPAVDRKLL